MKHARLVVLSLLGLVASGPRVGMAQAIDPNLWVTDGEVATVARVGNTIYIGGGFTQVGPATGHGVPINETTGGPSPSFPAVDGTVQCVAPDGSGGWYIGGLFGNVGGVPRSNLAHINSGLAVDAWSPNPDNEVMALAVSGSTVYAGGSFTSIGGQARRRLAAVDATSGLATSWDPNLNNLVRALATDGSTVYAGGSFDSVGLQVRRRIAAIDRSTGLATSWNPISNGDVWALLRNGPTLYVGGVFDTIGGQLRSSIAAIDSATGAATTWKPNATGGVYALALSGTTLYVGGDFTTLGNAPRNRIGAVKVLTNVATSWDPNANSTVFALAVSGSTVYAGGYFTIIAGRPRNRIAAIDAASGGALSWNPNANSYVYALAHYGHTVYAGGNFTSLGGQVRNNIAALDATTGAATNWNPSANQYVESIAANEFTVYVGGYFTTIGGQTRNHIAALDPASGAAKAWDPNANADVQCLSVSGSTVYAGGNFITIGGQSRNRIAALDTNGVATSWNPDAGGKVVALAVSDSTVYASGYFTTIGGLSRSHIAAIDAASGAIRPWDPNADDRPTIIVPDGGTVYVGGFFTSIGGQPRNYVAALEAATGAATPWDPNSEGFVYAIAKIGSTVYAGGYFSSIGGQPRNNIAALDPQTGLARSWNPNAGDLVFALTTGSTRVYAGGQFQRMGSLPQSTFAGIAAVPDLQAVEPSSGGNAGAATLSITGHGLNPGAAVRLSLTGQPDIRSDAVIFAADGASLTATFDLNGAAEGAWDVGVVNPDNQTATLPGGFTVTSVAAPQLRVDLLGPALARANSRTAFDLVIDNPGNVDALDVPLWLTGIPLDATVELDFALAYPPSDAGEPDWSTVPLGFTSPSGRYLDIVIPRVPPGTVSVTTFALQAALTPPWVDGAVFRGCLVNGGISPPCMGAELTAINDFLAGNPQFSALSGIGVWAKIAWQCENAMPLPNALAKAEQVLDFMVGPIEAPGSALAACSDVLPPRWRDSLAVTIVTSVDPNDKLGAQETLSVQQVIPYSIRFENASTASAPAQQVIISDPLDVSKLDPSTVSLDVITFGNIHIVPPPGLKSYVTQVDLRPTRNLLVNVSGSVDPFTGVLTWYFTSIDPMTGQPPTDPLAGFLPPNNSQHEGEGSVLFTVMPRPTLASGTQISNGATIKFDENAPHTTPTWLNFVDNTPPASHVTPLDANSDLPSIALHWTTEGAPQDLRDFTVYVAEDGAPYRVWRLNTMATTDTLVPPGNHQPHHYAFYSVARDASGNIEPPPGAPDATTQSRTAVGEARPLQLALEGARPNPALGSMRVWFTLPNREAATLDVIDIAGRRVLRREVGSLGPGTHSVTLDAEPPLRPGLYFLRLTQGSTRLDTRVALVQ